MSTVKITDLDLIPELQANSRLVVDDVTALVTYSVDMANIASFVGAAEVLLNADGGTPSTVYGGISPIDGGGV
jgi:hypothetical protein